MVDWPKGGRGWVAEALSFHIVLVQGRFFGRCCRIAVSSEDGKRRLFAIFMSIITKKVTPKSAGWSLLTWATLASFCDGLQRRAALLLKRFPRAMRPHSMVAAGTLIRDQLVTCADPITAKQCLAKCLATYLAMFGNDKVFTDNNHLTSTVIPLGIYCK